MYKLQSTQFLPMNLDEAWAFFSDPRKLAEITPPKMGFIIHDQNRLEKEIYPGMIIRYTVKPFGLAMTWVTEISQAKSPSMFVDEQRQGPYRFWHHQHRFREVDGGVEMEDIVHYALPLGILGRIAHSLFVRGELRRIFAYREKRLLDLFPTGKAHKQV